MPTTKQKNKIIKPVIIASAIIAVLIVGSISYVYGFNGNLFGWTARPDASTDNSRSPSSSDTTDTSNDDPTDIDENPPTEEQTDAGTDIKNGSGSGNEQPTTTTISLTSSISDNQLKIKTTINKVTNQGSCTLTLTKGSTQHSYPAGVQALPSYSACKGFTVDTSDFESGSWTAVVNFKDGSSQAKASKEITL